ncbi:MAG: OmpA family protein [Bacteroidetes bacterium]|nr:OmpA family protein [Bacteroidota bacterium]
MRLFIIGFLFLLAYVIPARWYFVCELRHHCGDEPAQVLSTRPLTLSLKDGDQAILQGYEQFAFPTNAIQPDLTLNNQDFLAKVAEYLKANPDKNITLAGRYLDSEKTAKSGIFENIGIARAAAVEQLLVKMGVDEKRFSIDHQLVKNTAVEEPISFLLYSPRPDGYDKPAYSFKDNTFSDANFAFGSDEFKPGEQCIAYADSVKIFLGANPKILLTITGHTDSIGLEKANLSLGLRRAKNAAEYFRELGVKAEIVTSSEGEQKPIFPNSTPEGKDNPEGRQKNRRVNFKLDEKPLK